uniref:Uncharacterized protein n=1 Tax=Arion vulgaris TaxID=1028688 RepID=A0A0B6ZUN0_9EUPU
MAGDTDNKESRPSWKNQSQVPLTTTPEFIAGEGKKKKKKIILYYYQINVQLLNANLQFLLCECL